MPSDIDNRSQRALPFLRAFVTVARLGTIRAAAIELNLTPGAVSHQVQMLEQVLQQALFRREKRRLILLPEGHTFREIATRVLADLGAGIGAIEHGEPFQHRASLAIAAPSGLAHIWLAPQLPDIADRIGLDAFEMHIARDMTAIDWRTIDIAIVYDSPPWSGCYWEALPELMLTPVCSPLLLHGLRHPRDILSQRLLHEDTGEEWQRWLNAARLDPPPRRSAYFNRLSIAFNAALTGQGVALMSEFIARKYLRSGQLVRPFVLAVPAASRYHVVIRETQRSDPVIGRCFELIIAVAHRLLPPFRES